MNDQPTRDDVWLEELLDQPELADDGFSAAIAARVQRHQLLRRITFLVAAGVSVAACLVVVPLDLSWIAALGIETWHVFAVLLISAVIGLFWQDTEPLSLPG